MQRMRALILHSAMEHQQELGRISFTGAVDLLRQRLPRLAPQAGVQAQGIARGHRQRAQPDEAWNIGAQSPETTTQNLSTAHLTSTPVPRNPPSRPVPRCPLTECHSSFAAFASTIPMSAKLRLSSR